MPESRLISAFLAVCLLAGVSCTKLAKRPGGGTEQGTGPISTVPNAVPVFKCMPTGRGTDYEVGPGLSLTTLGQVPFENLQPGDSVRVHVASQPYHEKVLMSASGTSDNFIVFCGIPDTSGNLPIIDGVSATTRSTAIYPTPSIEQQGLLIFTPVQGQPAGSIPSYIHIAHLQFQHAYPGNSFTNYQNQGNFYSASPAGIYVERGQHIYFHDVTLTANANGFVVNSSAATPSQVSKDILLEMSHVFLNGLPSSNQGHNIVTEALGMVFQFNFLESPAVGSQGMNLVDRSAGTVIRYNFMYPGAEMVNLVDSTGAPSVITADPSYRTSYVYGNILVNQGLQSSPNIIRYGGDSGTTANYRNGVLYFYNNTVVNRIDRGNPLNAVTLFSFDTNNSGVDARNNLFFNTSQGGAAVDIRLLSQNGIAFFGSNWISPNWTPYDPGKTFNGNISGTENFYVDYSNNPYFTDVTSHDFHLTSQSSAIGKGAATAAAVQGVYDVLDEYLPDNRGISRPDTNDLGAFEFQQN